MRNSIYDQHNECQSHNFFVCKVNIYIDESNRDLIAMPSHPPATVETVVYLKDTAHLTWRQIASKTKVASSTAQRWYAWWHKEGRTSPKPKTGRPRTVRTKSLIAK